MSEIIDEATVMVLLSYFSSYWRTDRRTNRHVSTQIFQIDGLLNFLKYGAPLARLRVQENIINNYSLKSR